MNCACLLIVTGLPATGKSRLARRLAERFGWPLLEKDAIKEALFDVLGAHDAGQSRRLSDASFAVLFAIARRLLASSRGIVLEGNFRAGEHEPQLQALASPAPRIVQVLCRVPEALRRARLAARAADPNRHRAHPDARGLDGPAGGVATPRPCDVFLALPGPRLIYDSLEANGASLGALERELERELACDAGTP
jgi:predicted kinase